MCKHFYFTSLLIILEKKGPEARYNWALLIDQIGFSRLVSALKEYKDSWCNKRYNVECQSHIWYYHHWKEIRTRCKLCKACPSTSLKIVSDCETNSHHKRFGVACLVAPPVDRVGGSLQPRSPLPSPPSTDVGWVRPLLPRWERRGSEPSSSSTIVWNAAKLSPAAATRPV